MLKKFRQRNFFFCLCASNPAHYYNDWFCAAVSYLTLVQALQGLHDTLLRLLSLQKNNKEKTLKHLINMILMMIFTLCFFLQYREKELFNYPADISAHISIPPTYCTVGTSAHHSQTAFNNIFMVLLRSERLARSLSV